MLNTKLHITHVQRCCQSSLCQYSLNNTVLSCIIGTNEGIPKAATLMMSSHARLNAAIVSALDPCRLTQWTPHQGSSPQCTPHQHGRADRTWLSWSECPTPAAQAVSSMQLQQKSKSTRTLSRAHHILLYCSVHCKCTCCAYLIGHFA